MIINIFFLSSYNISIRLFGKKKKIKVFLVRLSMIDSRYKLIVYRIMGRYNMKTSNVYLVNNLCSMHCFLQVQIYNGCRYRCTISLFLSFLFQMLLFQIIRSIPRFLILTNTVFFFKLTWYCFYNFILYVTVTITIYYEKRTCMYCAAYGRCSRRRSPPSSKLAQ